jgi:hypothetical protein
VAARTGGRVPKTHRAPAGRSHLSRRAVVLGGLGIVVAGGAVGGFELVQDGTLPGRYALARLDGACGSAPATPRGPLPTRREVTFYSAYRRRTVTMVTLIPAGIATARDLSVVVGLHGSGASARHLASQLGPAMTEARISTFAAMTVDGGDTYWHRRADGDDPVGMIIHEALPRLAAAGLRTGRIGISGDSMGGYGALLLAERLAGTAVSVTSARPSSAAGKQPQPAAVAALSPAIFATYADAQAANRDSFDSQADFDRNDVFAGLAALRTVPCWVGCGADDPFQPQAAQLRATLASITGHQPPGGILPGCHDDAFWARNWPGALAFLAAHLS